MAMERAAIHNTGLLTIVREGSISGSLFFAHKYAKIKNMQEEMGVELAPWLLS